METQARLTAIAPVLLVADVVRAAQYWTNAVGFEVELYHEPPRFGIARRDGCAVMLAQAARPAGIVPNWRVHDKTNDVYIWVDDCQTLYDELRARGATIDFTLYDTPWGTREFGIQDLDDHDIAFGQVLR